MVCNYHNQTISFELVIEESTPILLFITVFFYPSKNAIHRLINIQLWRATYVLVDGTTWAGFCSPGTPS